MKIRRHTLTTISMSFCLASVAQGAFAQNQANPADGAASSDAVAEVIVTGTHIARPDLEVASPVTVIGTAELSRRQVITADDLLKDMPMVRPSLGPSVNNGGDGSSSVNLRGLGTNRTLVLIDSRRIVPFGLDGVTDLNTVPLAMVERVDVVTGGASSTYGADAVAGVVNFITKRNFEGIELSSGYRLTERGDGRQYHADLTMGSSFNDNRGNAVLSVGYNRRDPLEVFDRSFAYVPLSSGTGQYAGSTSAPQTILSAPSNESLGLAPSNIGAIYVPETGLLRTATVDDTYNSNENTFLLTGLERVNIYATARNQIAAGVELYGTAWFTRNKTRIRQSSSATFANTYSMPLSNAYLPSGVRSQLCNSLGLSSANCALAATAATPSSPGYREVRIQPQRRFVEFGPRNQHVDSDVYQIVGGVRGDIAPKLHYDVSAQYGETVQNQSYLHWGSSAKVQQALRSYRDSSGTPVCSDTQNNCVPLNLFGPAAGIPADQIAFLDLTALINRTVTQEVITGSVNGDLFSLTSPLTDSAVAFSLGGEYRRLSAEANPDAASQVQGAILGRGARVPPDRGAYDVNEVFGELIAPLVSDKPYVHSLQAEVGARYSDYSTTGGSFTWKSGLSYQPVSSLKLRGMYQVAVRSPNVQELFQSGVTALANLSVDPCQATQLPSAAANPALAALCVATGAPTGTIGNIPPPNGNQINTALAGNPNLQTEEAKTITFGVVLTPTAIPTLSATADYFRIRVTDAITRPALGDILNGCFSSALNPGFDNNNFCSLIRRNPLTGGLSGGADTQGVLLGGSNLGAIETAGVDLGVNYQLDFANSALDKLPGALAVSFNGTWLDYYHFQASPISINRDCTGYYSSNCGAPRQEFRWNSRVTYQHPLFDASMLWNHIGSSHLEPFSADVIQPLSTPQTAGPAVNSIFADYRSIAAYDSFDLSLKTKLQEHAELVLTVTNLFDQKPPIVGNTVAGSEAVSGNTFPGVYDVLGRSFSIGVRLDL